MATFTWIPEFPPTESSKPRVRKTALGDGYEHRVRFGLNTDLKAWDLEFKNRDLTETEALRSFLEARGGVESFTWTAPFFTSTAKQFLCEEWEVIPENCNLFTIRASFRQVPEPS